MNAAIFRFFFTLAPNFRRLARERRNEKQQKSLLMEAFFVPEIERLRSTNRCLHRHNEKTMSHLAELVASAKAAINQASDVAALDNVRVEYLGKKGT